MSIDPFHIIVIFISFGAAFFSGLLGIGGGIIVFPSFLYILPFLGFKPFTVNEISGIAATQSLVGIFFAFMNHRKYGIVNYNLVRAVLPMGIIAAILGSIVAKFISELIMLYMYLALLIVSSVIILIPGEENIENVDTCKLEKPILTNLSIFLGIFTSGTLGFAGAVTFMPVLNLLCKAPVKVAISTTTFIVFISAIIIFAGKAAVGLVPFDLLIPIIIGAVMGARCGAFMNRKLPPHILKLIFFLIIVILGIRIFLTILEY